MTQVFSLYKTTNIINGKIYIGIHREDQFPVISSYIGSGVMIKKAIQKYGKNNFSKEVLVVTDSHQRIMDIERKYVDAEFVNCDNNYNVAIGGSGGISFHSEETKRKIRDALLGRVFSDDHKKRIGDGNKTRVWTKEAKAKISKAHKGKVISKEQRKLLSEAGKGRIVSDEKKEWWRLNNPNSKECMVLGKKYRSAAEASRETGIRSMTVIRNIASDKYKNFYYTGN